MSKQKMTIEHLTEEILSKRPDISKQAIMEKLEKERTRTNGLISEETLLRMIAAELGVAVSKHHTVAAVLSIKDLVPSLNDVSVVGRVVAVFPPKAFTGRRSGRFASLLMIDRTGMLRVVMWNDKTSLIESEGIEVGQLLRLSHGYTKEGRGGTVELHVGEKCEVELAPREVDGKDFPWVDAFMTKIAEVSSSRGNARVSVEGTVTTVFPASTFERSDLSVGKIMRFALADESGEISVVAWNEKVNELEQQLKEGAGLQVVDAKVRRAMGGGLELHVDSDTYVETMPLQQEKVVKIADLRVGLTGIVVEGSLASKPVFKEVRTSQDEPVSCASFELADETGRVWVSAWRRHAETARAFGVGDKVVMRNVCVKKGINDQPEIGIRESSSINASHQQTLS